jgi:hypothetical protein
VKTNHAVLERHLQVLQVGYPPSIANDLSSVIVHDFVLPPGFNRQTMDVLIELPRDYPLTPPGLAKRVYLPNDLRYRGRKLVDLHLWTTPGWGNWAYFCYNRINWDPQRDDLVRFLEMIRADLTDPKTT